MAVAASKNAAWAVSFSRRPLRHSDQRIQKLILIWASRNMDGIIEKVAAANDRPKPFRRPTVSKSATPGNEAVAPPAPPAPELPQNKTMKPAPSPPKNTKDDPVSQTETKS